MNRDKAAWSRVVVCVSKSTITVLGQDASGTNGSTLLINRVHLSDIVEVPTAAITEASYKSVMTGHALVGFLELRNATYLGLITKASPAGYIGDHKVMSISDLEWIPVSFGVSGPSKTDARYLALISNLFKANDFFFSETFDLASTRSRFAWNSLHLRALSTVDPRWTVPQIHGAFRSTSFHSNNRRFEFVLIARRSRLFAGTRFRKRGLNINGDCANEIETEQILISYGPPDHVFSFKQVRGSVPLHWSQATAGIMPKPEIVISGSDLELTSTRNHFENLSNRYRSPIIPVSLLIRREGSNEAVLGNEFAYAVDFIRSTGMGSDVMPVVHFDMKGASVDLAPACDTAGGNLPSAMYEEVIILARELIGKVGWTQCGQKQQSGIIRTNCIDCLDRTSIFQNIVGLEVLRQQLVQLGVLDTPLRPTWVNPVGTEIHPNSLVPVIESMMEEISDVTAIQYAGTATHKKYSSNSRSHSLDGGLLTTGREIFISISRHYSSAFTDNDKQNSYNLFLGLYRGIWNNLGYDEDCCGIEGVDQFAHSRIEPDLEQEHENPQLRFELLLVDGASTRASFTPIHTVIHGPSKAIFFNSTDSSLPRRSPSLA